MEEDVMERKQHLIDALQEGDEQKLLHLVNFTDDEELDNIKATLATCESILPWVCELGFTDVVEKILNFELLDVDSKHQGKTGLQYACRSGKKDIVNLLLKHGAKVQKHPEHKESEFYQASLHGHLQIVDILMNHIHRDEPAENIIMDESVQYCLMYAACCGGHLGMMIKWLNPNCDVNRTIEFTNSLTDCENEYPLFAAFQGEHYDVAKCLILDNGASITEDICNNFPTFTTNFIKLHILKSDSPGKHEYNMPELNIAKVLPEWFATKMKTDTEDEDEDLVEITINLAKNKLKTLPDGVLWSLQELVDLNVSKNPLGKICDPLDLNSLDSSRIRTLNLSDCQLEAVSFYLFCLPCLMDLNLSHNKLTSLGVTEGLNNPEWRCKKLTNLDVSYNSLSSLPSGLQVCTDLVSLNVSHNQLSVAFSPWQCPLTSLNLSHNKLNDFSPSADQFWNLSRLELQHNQLDVLPQSIVKMDALSHLYMSNNKVKSLPSPGIWRCSLVYFDISNNNLGKSTTDFPEAYLSQSLLELYLANNGLAEFPKSICNLQKLSVLDITQNPNIKSLPSELGKLKRLLVLKIDNIRVKEDTELQSLISSMNHPGRTDVNAQHIVKYLERKLRNCIYPNVVKMVVLGCKNAGGHCVVQKLVEQKRKSVAMSDKNHEEMTIEHWTFTPRRNFLPGLSDIRNSSRKSVAFEIWELPDMKVTSALQPCFLTLNSLYLIVHDMNAQGANLHSVSEKIFSIRACALRSKILVVCTCLDVMDKGTREKIELQIKTQAEKDFPRIKFLSLMFGKNVNIEELQQELYSAYTTMKDSSFEREHLLCKRQVPSSFIDVMNKVKNLKYNICTMDELLTAIDSSPKDLEDGVDSNLKLHEFLLQVGAMLHYKNIQIGELSACVILNPAWLFSVLSKFLKSLTEGRYKQAQLPISLVKGKFQDMLPKDRDYFDAFLHLLEVFNIGVRIGEGGEKDVLLVPSLLPKQPPQLSLDPHTDGLRALRLYSLPVVPSALWSHVISELIAAFERLSSSNWRLGDKHRSSLLDRTMSFKRSCKSSLRGLHILNKNIQYWRTGIMIYHDQGYVVVEEVEHFTHSSEEPHGTPGILITVQTTGSKKEDDPGAANMKKLAVIGIVKDEIEEIIELFNPKFQDPSEGEFKCYALCPHCHVPNIRPLVGTIRASDLHFDVRYCSQMLLWDEFVICQGGSTNLSHLVPECLFLELPPELQLLSRDITLSNDKLGHGIAGQVTKATYKGKMVAVKVFHTRILKPPDDAAVRHYPNVGNWCPKVDQTRAELDQIETEQRKITNAFSDVRREVGILSKLKHNCIIAFIGVCVRPRLMLVLELAPLGSLRTELEKRFGEGGMLPRKDITVITKKAFSKTLTYKIIMQIGSGLAYLHKNKIIFRDLKPDNILVMSLEEMIGIINVKLTDYGISKFTNVQGLSGLYGTVGYMAPEIMTKKNYTEKVDIYSYAIVMLETLTGIPPIEKNQKVLLSQSLNVDATPAHIQGYKIQCNFPALERLMVECWNPRMDSRPSAEDIVTKMAAYQFFLLHDSVSMPESNPDLEIACLCACETVGRWNIWICETGLPNHRYFSVYDVESSCFTISRISCPGPKVNSMAKIGSKIWLACQDSKTIEEIGRGKQSKFEVGKGLSLDAEPTKIFNHTFQSHEGTDSFTIIGLVNGSVTAIYISNSHRKSVKTITNIELHNDIPIASICSVNESMLAVACGMKIYLLEVSLHENSTDSKPANSVKRALVPELINCGSVSLQKVLSIYEPVEWIVADGNAVWCSLEDSSCLVKVDVERKEILITLTLSWDPRRDTVRLREKDKEQLFHQRFAVSDSDVRSNTLPLEGDFLARFKPSHQSNSIIEDEVFAGEVSKTSASNTNHFPTPGVATTIHNDPVDKTSKSPCCSRKDNEDASSSDEDAVTYYYEIPDDLEDPWKPIKASNRNPEEKIPEVVMPPEQTPPVPPRRMLNKKKSASLPRQSTSPPPLPQRSGFRELSVTVTSMVVSTDILLVGTNRGGIFLLPLKADSERPDGFPDLPLQLSLLRHPAKEKKLYQRMRSLSSVSSMPQDTQSACTRGKIETLTLAKNKLVSLHTLPSQVLRHDPSSVSRGSENDRRQGSIFSREDVESLQTSIRDLEYNRSLSQNVSSSSLSGHPFPESEDRSRLSNHSNQLVGGQHPGCEIEDIAIWDEISSSCLMKLKAYSDDLKS